QDLWSGSEDSDLLLEKEQIRYCLFQAHQRIGNIPTSELSSKRNFKQLKNFKKDTDFEFVQNSKIELYRIYENTVEIIMAKDKEMNDRLLLGQALLYRKHLFELYPYHLNIRFFEMSDGIVQEFKI
ncbi:MAG: hypothetical protein Q4A54_05370, partial [Parabacteroides sp.]|nr:hypothetical protein [Parabacteroides sp.]